MPCYYLAYGVIENIKFSKYQCTTVIYLFSIEKFWTTKKTIKICAGY